jgi:glycosyltransferase involved in cell wall biosynthesis
VRVGIDASCWANSRGYGRYTRELITAILEVDQRNSYTLFLDAATERLSPDLPARANRVVVQTSSAASLAAAADGHRSIRDLWAMSRAVGSRRHDLDLFYFPSVYTFFPVPGRLRPLVTVHDTTPERHPALVFPHRHNRWLWNAKVGWAIRGSSFILTVSESARQAISEQFGLSSDRVRIVPDAVSPRFRPSADSAERRRILAGHGVEPGRRYLLYVGGISPHKSIDTLVDAHAQLARDEAFQDVQLVLVGDYKRDVFLSSYDALRKRTGASVIFTGFVPDEELTHWYGAASVVVLPSVDEGFGLPAIEAMACGTPVVASRAGALPEVVANAGLLFEPRNVGGLVEALKTLLADTSLRHRLSDEGLKRAAQFTWQASARAAIGAFEEVERGLSLDHQSA